MNGRRRQKSARLRAAQGAVKCSAAEQTGPCGGLGTLPPQPDRALSGGRVSIPTQNGEGARLIPCQWRAKYSFKTSAL